MLNFNGALKLEKRFYVSLGTSFCGLCPAPKGNSVST